MHFLHKFLHLMCVCTYIVFATKKNYAKTQKCEKQLMQKLKKRKKLTKIRKLVCNWLNPFRCRCVSPKLMRLGVPNQIIDDWDIKLSEFDHRLRYKSDSDSNYYFESTIAISI